VNTLHPGDFENCWRKLVIWEMVAVTFYRDHEESDVLPTVYVDDVTVKVHRSNGFRIGRPLSEAMRRIRDPAAPTILEAVCGDGHSERVGDRRDNVVNIGRGPRI